MRGNDDKKDTSTCAAHGHQDKRLWREGGKHLTRTTPVL